MHIGNLADEVTCNEVASVVRSIPGETLAFQNVVYGLA